MNTKLLWHRLTFRWPRRLLELLGRKEYCAAYHWWDSGVQFHANDRIKAWSFRQAAQIALSRCPESRDSLRRSTFAVCRSDQLIG